MWILTSCGYANSHHVVEISTDHSGERAILHLVNGKTALVLQCPFELVAEFNDVIPAQPGFEMLCLYDPGEQPAYSREPIIAWRITGEAHESRIAITPSGSSQFMARVAILYPDGQVQVPDGADGCGPARYPNVETWLASEHEARAAPKAGRMCLRKQNPALGCHRRNSLPLSRELRHSCDGMTPVMGCRTCDKLRQDLRLATARKKGKTFLGKPLLKPQKYRPVG